RQLSIALFIACLSSAACSQGTVMQSVSDVFVGRNAVGPYLLSWRGIEPKSESVSVGVGRLNRDSDYTLDPATGTLAFRNPLRTGEVARIDYRVDARTAKQTASLPAAPFEFKLFNAGSAGLSLNALWKPSTGSGGPNQSPLGMMLLGFGG